MCSHCQSLSRGFSRIRFERLFLEPFQCFETQKSKGLKHSELRHRLYHNLGRSSDIQSEHRSHFFTLLGVCWGQSDRQWAQIADRSRLEWYRCASRDSSNWRVCRRWLQVTEQLLRQSIHLFRCNEWFEWTEWLKFVKINWPISDSIPVLVWRTRRKAKESYLKVIFI